jgi:regulator of protease activity HflC (stomatin/prohibitin superfamily)
MADTGQELIAAALASVDGRVQQQIEAARQRRERQAQQRAELNAARAAGIGRRNAAKLRHQANRGDTPTVADPRSPDSNATMVQSTTVPDPRGAADHAATTDTVTTAAFELRSRYIPRAREASVKEARDGRE